MEVNIEHQKAGITMNHNIKAENWVKDIFRSSLMLAHSMKRSASS